MDTNSIDAYEANATDFLQHRDRSNIGIQTAQRWARSLKPGTKTIEIACGGGIPVTQTLLDARLKLWAIDSSPSLVKIFKQRFPEVPVQCASVLESDFFGLRFEAAISIGLIFLLQEADQIKMLERVSSHLEPGASFLFTAPVETASWTDLNTGLSCVSLGQDAYQAAFREFGFNLVDCHQDSGKNNYYQLEKI